VATLAHGKRQAGDYTIAWDGRNNRGEKPTSGVYLYRLLANTNRAATRKLLLLR